MGTGWQVVAFPVILPWREEFWTLPLYFPDLKVGVLPDWPGAMPYQSLPLPLEAQGPEQEWRHYRPGDLRQWHAFVEFRSGQEEVADIIQALRGQAPEPPPEREPSPGAWAMAWQLERMQADQEAQLLRVDRGQAWLQEILTPEPWEEGPKPEPGPGLTEMVDPELAVLRYRLWRRVMAPFLQAPWAPLLLGRTSRAIFLALKGWPQWTLIKRVQVSLPGCRREEEWTAIQGGSPEWRKDFQALLMAALAAAAAGDLEKLRDAARELNRFGEDNLAPRWPASPPWRWDLEIWARDPEEEAEPAPVLCWTGAGAGILPG